LGIAEVLWGRSKVRHVQSPDSAASIIDVIEPEASRDARLFSSSRISPEQLEHFNQMGWLLTDTLDAAGVERLRCWMDEISDWPADGDGWMHHYELTEEGPKLCRSENLIPFHNGLKELLTTGELIEAASALIGSPAALYKEKINYKLAGGAGYAPHQDAPAYPFIDSHVSCLVAIDDATEGNGCLEVVSAHHQALLETDDSGCITQDVVRSLQWDLVEVQAGQTLWFHSRTPHRSGPNNSLLARRALYPTYNALAEGDLRNEYYERKLAEFAEAEAVEGRVRVSLIGDFQGRAVL